jgi:hypothetical protein
MMHSVFSLLRINSLCMFQALFAHHQEALRTQLVHCVCIMSAGCYQGWSDDKLIVLGSCRGC